MPEEYWTLDACLDAGAPPPFLAHLVKHKSKNIKPGSVVAVEKILDALDTAEFRVAKIDTKPQRRNPAPPFITSSLQMDANRKLRFPPKKTMSLAQRLYEGMDLGDEGPVGLITYMRSDSTRVSAEALDAVRTFIEQTYGGEYLPAAPNRFKSPKGAQEAHEAIRPTGVMRRPQDVKAFLSKDELALYELIWRRFVASQMTPAVFDLTTVDIAAADYLFRATASVLKFAGFTKVYQESRDTEEAAGPEKFPPLAAGDVLQLRDFDPQQHFTKPPARYTEASLIKELEVQGIGRPSTYATILTNLQDRLYVVKEKTALKPTEMGLVVSDLLVENFPDIMDPKFTAGLEDDLDRVADGKVPWQTLMRDFYGPFAQELEAAKTGMRKVKSVPTESDLPGVRRRARGALGQKRRVRGLRRLSQVRLHRGFRQGCPGPDNPCGDGTGGPRVPGRSARPGPGGQGQARGRPGLPAPSAKRNCCCAGGGWESFWVAPATPSASSPRISAVAPKERSSPSPRKTRLPSPAPGKAAAAT